MDLTKLERKPDENIKDWPQVCTVSIFFRAEGIFQSNWASVLG